MSYIWYTYNVCISGIPCCSATPHIVALKCICSFLCMQSLCIFVTWLNSRFMLCVISLMHMWLPVQNTGKSTIFCGQVPATASIPWDYSTK